MDSIPKAIEDLMAHDPEGEVEIVLRRARRAPPAEAAAGAEAPAPDMAAGAPGGPAAAPEGAALSALQASLNRGGVAPRAPKSYSMPRKAR